MRKAAVRFYRTERFRAARRQLCKQNAPRTKSNTEIAWRSRYHSRNISTLSNIKSSCKSNRYAGRSNATKYSTMRATSRDTMRMKWTADRDVSQLIENAELKIERAVSN